MRRKAGLQAAFGARTPLRSRLRRAALHFLRRLEGGFGRRGIAASYLEILPSPRTAKELADIAARCSWYLPESRRKLPLFAASTPAAAAAAGPPSYLDPSLSTAPGWTTTRPAGKPHVVVHRLTAPSLARYLAGLGRATLVDPHFAYPAEEGFFTLHKRFCDTEPLGPHESLSLLIERARPEGSVFVLATGPSAQLVDPADITDDVRITCNSAVRDRDLIEALRPDVIAFGDPVFHHGPSRYAAQFRSDLLRAAESTDAVLLTTHYFVEPLIAHCPQIRTRLAVLPLTPDPPWRWPTPPDPSARSTGNVLTNLMLPAAFALGRTVRIAGCDGRRSNERYFWKHNRSTQYTDELMQTVFDAHPAFFRDRDYADYYAGHCRELEEFLTTAERAGRTVEAVTPSHIPALLRRGAPDFEEESPR